MSARIETPPTVGAVMHGPIVSVATDDSLWTAVDVMLSRGLRHVVVVDGETARGMLADRELAAVWAMDPLGPKNRSAAEVMPPGRTFVGPGVDVVTAALHMRSLGVDALVVVDDQERPLGVVTDHDLLGVLAGLLGGARDGASGGATGVREADRSALVPD